MTLELIDPSFDNMLGENWEAVSQGGTPGMPNTGINSIEQPSVSEPFARFDCFPNPFADFTTLQFNVQDEGHFRLEIFDMKGQLQVTLIDEFLSNDTYYIDWDGTSGTGDVLKEGLYLVRLSSATSVQTKKILKLK
jgi:hypothetical protein